MVCELSPEAQKQTGKVPTSSDEDDLASQGRYVFVRVEINEARELRRHLGSRRESVRSLYDAGRISDDKCRVLRMGMSKSRSARSIDSLIYQTVYIGGQGCPDSGLFKGSQPLLPYDFQ
jgi:ribosomal protein L19E